MNAERLEEELEALGDHWASITEKLYKAGIKGFRRSALECPIANYVRGLCGGNVDVFAELNSVAVGEWDSEKGHFTVEFEVPTPISDSPLHERVQLRVPQNAL